MFPDFRFVALVFWVERDGFCVWFAGVIFVGELLLFFVLVWGFVLCDELLGLVWLI